MPGSGGHRYKRSLTNLSFDQVGGHMHDFTVKTSQLYCNEDTPVPTYEVEHIVLTHTMNSDIIRKKFAGHTVVKLKADFKKSMLREWDTVIKNTLIDRPIADVIDSMFQLIIWHKDYYTKYPIDYIADQVIDIDLVDTEFGKIMRRELDMQNQWFEFAWTAFENFGYEAPIIDLVNNSANSLLVTAP